MANKGQNCSQRKDLISDIMDQSLESKINGKALSAIDSELIENPLQAIQECELTEDVSENSQESFAWKTVINKIILFRNLLYMKYRSLENMGDHVTVLEFPFTRLATLRSGWTIRSK